MNAVLVVIVGLAISFALALVVALLVALPGLRAEGRLKYSSDVQRFRLPGQWTGYDDEVHEFFGHDDGTSHLGTRHWKIPESGTGWRTTAGLLFSSRGT